MRSLDVYAAAYPFGDEGDLAPSRPGPGRGHDAVDPARRLDAVHATPYEQGLVNRSSTNSTGHNSAVSHAIGLFLVRPRPRPESQRLADLLAAGTRRSGGEGVLRELRSRHFHQLRDVLDRGLAGSPRQTPGTGPPAPSTSEWPSRVASGRFCWPPSPHRCPPASSTSRRPPVATPTACHASIFPRTGLAPFRPSRVISNREMGDLSPQKLTSSQFVAGVRDGVRGLVRLNAVSLNALDCGLGRQAAGQENAHAYQLFLVVPPVSLRSVRTQSNGYVTDKQEPSPVPTVRRKRQASLAHPPSSVGHGLEWSR